MATRAQRLQEQANTNNRSISRLSFPSDLMTEGSGNIIRFSINLPTGSKYLANGDYKRAIDPSTGRETTSVYRRQNSNSLARKFSQNYVRTNTTIDLYMPNQIQSSYQSDWNTTELGILGALIDAGTSLGDLSWGNAQRLWQVASNTASESIKSTLAGTVQALTPIAAQDALKTANSTVANPYMEVVFNGIQNRTFSFTFKMVPENRKEQETIQKIVEEFRFHMAPEVKYQEQNNYWIFPSEFDIKFIHRTTENPWLFKISTCALTNLTINHSPEGQFAAHADGSPFATEMTLQFTELEFLTKSRHKEGY